MANWHLIYSKAQQELVAKTNLEQQSYPVYLPMCSVQKRVRGVCRMVVEPMFPRYLFIELDALKDDWGPIRSTRGVSHLVRFGGFVAKVKPQLIEFLRDTEQKLFDAQLAKKNKDLFHKGQRLLVSEGPFVGYEALYQEKRGANRCKILLDLVGKDMLLDIAEDYLIEAV